MRKLLSVIALACSMVSTIASEAVSSGQPYEFGLTVTGRSAALAAVTNATHISGNSDWSLVLRSNGSLFAWGRNTEGQTNVPSGTTWRHAFAGWHHGIACRTDGTVDEWGTPYGNDITGWEALRPSTVTNANIIQVAAGDDHSLALRDDGVVCVWGGRVSVTNFNGLITDAVEIDSTWYCGLALRENGTVVLIGYENSQSGGSTAIPAGLNDGHDIVHIACSQFSMYALKSDGTVVGWGMPNTYGQFTTPAAASNLTMVAAGIRHAIGLRNDGRVFAWGDNAQGQCTIPATLTNANFVGAGRYYSQAIQPSGGTGGGGGQTVYYVAKTGSDSNGGTEGLPFLTVQKGIDTATTSGNVVIVGAGDYPEYVTSKASGITLLGAGNGESSIRAFRANNHTNLTVDGITFWKGQAGNSGGWGQSVRVESAAHNLTVRSCVFRDTPSLIRSNFVFNGTSNTVYSPSGSDWSAAGFEVGGRIRTGASSIEPYTFSNSDANRTIVSISGNVLTVDDFVAETNASAWSVVYASGLTHTGIRGVEMIQSGGASASNLTIAGCTFTNLFGFGVNMSGNGPISILNSTFDTVAWAALHFGGHNATVASNTFLNNEKWLFYSAREANDVPHPAGAGAYDFVQGYLRSDGEAGTNVTFSRNWVENVHNPLGQLYNGGHTLGWTIAGNVFIGVQKQWDSLGTAGNLTAANNTFYRVGFDTGGNGHALNESTGDALDRATNHVNMRNLYLDIGPHVSTNAEGFYARDYLTGGYFGSNYVASAESLGWQGKSLFTEIDGINGGDPLLVNPQSPRGDDGLPFTADDGLRPLPNSPLALKSIGALAAATPAASTPVAHFTVRPAVPGWYDATGTNFNTAWESVPPFARTNFVRPWNTLEALGDVPAQVFIDASGSISGSLSTNSNWGINLYQFDWGDGAVDGSWTATNSHVYLWPGTFTITTKVRNSSGAWATNALSYRVLPQDQYSGTVRHVATNGNDSTGSGSLAAPYATIAKAVSMVVAGDYIAVHPGDYDSDTDVNRNVANSGARIAIHGFGAKIGAAKFRYPYWTIHGFDVDGNPTSTGAGIYVHQAADDIHIRNCWFHDFGGSLFGGVYAVGGGDLHPLNQSLNGRIIGCTFTNINSPCIQIFGGSNWMVSNFQVYNTIGEGDFIRPRGANHTIQDGYIFNLNSGGGGGHPDFMQLDNQGGDGYWFKDILIQRVYAEGDTNAPSGTDGAMGQIETGAYADSVRYTNCIVRNCIFKNFRATFSDSNDGFKFYNNLFYRSPRVSGNVTAGGGERGSSWGTTFRNNIFYGNGLTDADNTGWYYTAQSGTQATNTSVSGDFNFAAGITGNDKDLGQWTYNGQEAHGINGGSPLFADEASGDYRLTTNSPLYLHGTSLAALPGIEGFATDYLGQPISSWSIGPFSVAANASGAAPPPTDTTAPTPDPMTWSSVPAATTNSVITMTASTATDAASPPVQYYFDETSGNPGGSDSGWILSPSYTDTGLSGSTQYTYRVAARDALGNQTAWSSSQSDTTDADPIPDPAGPGTLNATAVNAGEVQ